MLALVLDAIGCLLVGAVAIHSVVLHIRLGRFRTALAEVGRVLSGFDASVNQMTELTRGFSGKLMAELESVEGRLMSARRLGTELAAASRTAEDAASQLERLLRQHKRIEAVRAAALPRELVEPKGFAERAGLPPVTPAVSRPAESASPTADPLPATADTEVAA